MMDASSKQSIPYIHLAIFVSTLVPVLTLASAVMLISHIVFTPHAISGEYWLATCINVVDGDIIDVNDFHGHTFRLRLRGVDCPKVGQAFSDKARAFTEKMVLNKDIRFFPMERDKHGRTVAWVSVDGKSLNDELVKNGLAWWYRRFEPRNERLRALESQARRAKRGFWADPNGDPIPPWKWRKSQREKRGR